MVLSKARFGEVDCAGAGDNVMVFGCCAEEDGGMSIIARPSPISASSSPPTPFPSILQSCVVGGPSFLEAGRVVFVRSSVVSCFIIVKWV